MFVFLMSVILAPMAFPNAAEPPNLIVIVSFPPDDLTLSIRFADGSMTNAIQLYKEQKVWEAYYRFFHRMVEPEKSSFKGAALIAQSNEKNFECLLPESAFKKYNNLLTLNVVNESITEYQSSQARSLFLVSVRVILTLLIEGLIFFGFGYRNKESWIAFIVVNLLTQGALNMIFAGPILGHYWFIGFAFCEIVIFIVEMVTFALILKEHKKGRAIVYALTANWASLILGSILITSLPV